MHRLAPAKINWDLHILGKRPDGFHELDSLFVTVSIADELTVEPADAISLTCSDPTLPVDGSNLIVRAAHLLAQKAGVKRGAKLHIEKRIPMGGGMGGGSSDAACTLRALNDFWNVGWSIAQLAPLAAQLGSDVSFFLYGGWALCCGRGEIVDSIAVPESSTPLKLALVLPPLHVATPAVYKALNAPPLNPSAGRNAAQARAELHAALAVLRAGSAEPINLRNDLTAAALVVEPRLGAVQAVLARHFPGRWLMSGSGASHFAVLPAGFAQWKVLEGDLNAAVPGTRVVEASL